ncbi:penicillin-binding protein [Streptomyces cinnamoneus]|uniref:Penicillin-binding protein n=1 Tax=Streptomyces cinnamoneus TaxID=53446 RepID=A0A2G1XE80_STRCJ|nr:transglycosylase domain-containing protein [Streptomyces cinnamoneus]PHQ49522.1 penicillin-binding protein [Streptomyces cinnamoneus]PPT14758.1 penicillin-binding protein [Streptomyces cinnamoneus]
MGRAEARRAQKRGTGPGTGGKKPKKTGIRRFFTWKMLLAYFVGVIALGAGAFYALYLYVDVPGEGNKAAQLQSNVYKSADGKTIARIGQVNREEVPLDKVPENIRNAVVAAENKNFWTDPGVDLKGTARGIINTVMGRGKQGGSTITQQYIKNYYLDQRQTVSRKVKELIISLKVQDKLSKKKILEGYLNTSYYGRGAYGIQAASRAYYNKDVDKLTLEEGAYLAALLQAPSQYDWSQATEAGKTNAKKRWNYVLDKMVEQKWLGAAERQSMQFKEPGKAKPAAGLAGQNGYLVEAAKREIIRDLVAQGRTQKDAEQEFEAGGWTVTLSIDPTKQKALEKAVHDKLLAELEPGKREVDKHVQAGAVSVDPKTGKVVALYGGQDFIQHQVSNATRADYQPASTFKPLILASALENNSKTQEKKPITPATIYDGTNKRPVVGPGGGGYAPENEDQHSYGPITVQQAMNDSVNSVFAQMVVDVGMDKVKKTAVELGMKSDFEETPAMALGAMGASPMEMAGVYATLDNHGKKVTPSIVASATHRGQEFSLPNAVGATAVDRNTADGLTSVLTGVVNDGTANVVSSAEYQVAGKTGTSDEDLSAWFAGYTPSLVTTVGLFGEDMEKNGKQVTLQNTGGNGRVNGGTYPAKIWAAYNAAVFGDDDKAKFDLETDEPAAPAAPPSPKPSTSPSASTSPKPSNSPSASTSPKPSNSSSSAASPKPSNSTKQPPTPKPSSSSSTGSSTGPVDPGTRPNGGLMPPP